MFKKENIKKFIVLALVFAFVFLVFAYMKVVAFNNGAKIDIVAETEDTMEYPVTDQLAWEHTFTYEADMIRGVLLKFMYSDETISDGLVTVDLYDVADGSLLGSSSLKLSSLSNIDYTVFAMPELIKNVKDKELRLSVKFSGFKEGEMYFYGVPGQDGQANAYLFKIISAGKDSFYTVLQIVYVCIIIAIMTVFVMALFSKKIKLENAYLVAGLLLGFVITLLIPVASAPDEYTHLYISYQFSNDMMGVESVVDGSLTMRYSDAMAYLQAKGLERNYYNEYFEGLFEKVESETLVDTGVGVSYAPRFLYFFSALGLTIGRSLGLGTVLTFLLGRWFNMIAFVLVTYFAMRKIPFGKAVVYVWALLPIMLQQTGSFSYDCLVNALCILIISLTLRFMYGEKHNAKKGFYMDVAILAIACYFLLPCKSYAFFPVVIMPLMLLVKYIKDNWEKIKRLLEKKPTIKKVVIGLLVICVIGAIVVVLYVLRTLLANADGNGAYIGWAKQCARPLGYYIKHPVELVSIVVNTLMASGEGYLIQMFGGSLGWLDVSVSMLFTLPMILMLIYAGMRREDEEQPITVGNKIWMWFVFLGVCACACFGMLMQWTPATSLFILGIQGRYFLPALVPAIVAIRTKTTQVSKNADKIIACVIPFLYIFIVSGIFRNKF